jgi:hypothetical protein
MARAPLQDLKADDLISNISNSEMISDFREGRARARARTAAISEH